MPVLPENAPAAGQEKPQAQKNPFSPSTPVYQGPAISADFVASVEEYVRVDEMLTSIKTAHKSAVKNLATNAPDEPGAHVIEEGGWKVTFDVAEKWSWDKDALEEKFGDGPLPPYVKRNYRIDKRRFESLSPSEQTELLGLLTIAPGAVKITVEKA